MLLPAFSSGASILKHVAEIAADNLTTNSFFTDDQPWPAFLDCIFASVITLLVTMFYQSTLHIYLLVAYSP